MVSNYMSTIHMIMLPVSDRIIQEWFMMDSGQITLVTRGPSAGAVMSAGSSFNTRILQDPS